MNERSGTVRLVEPRESEARGLVTTISRKEVEEALQHDAPVDLLLDVDRVAADGVGREKERIALAWEPRDLEQLLAQASDDEITLTFDESELQQLLDEDVDAHGMREKLAVLTVVAGLAAGGAGSAAAMTYGGGSEGGTAAAAPAVVASEISTGLNAPAPAAAPAVTASEVSSGIVQQPPVAPAEVTTGIVQHPTATPVSASPGDSSWAPSGATIALVAGSILAIAAAGFAVRTQRRRPAMP